MAKKSKSGPVKVRVEPKALLLGRNSGYVQDSRYALGGDSRYSTVPPKAILSEEDYRRIKETERPPEPEAVDLSKGSVDEWIVKEANLKDVGRKAGDQRESLEAERSQLKADLSARQDIARERGIDIRADVRIVERRIAAIDKKLGLEKAA